MRYTTLLKGETQPHELEIQETTPGRFAVTVDGKRWEVDAQTVGPDTLSLLIDGHSYNIEYERDAAGFYNLLVRGDVLSMEVLEPRLWRARQISGAREKHGGKSDIRSPMPGKIVNVAVKAGDVVTAGQGLVVVEAMKMENELKSPKDGKVSQVLVHAGQAVEGNALLCVVE